jgi:hypothetical protein
MILGLLRILIGFALACLAAAAAQVAFALTPAQFVTFTVDRWWQVGELVLRTATLIAIFAAPFALVAVIMAEAFGLRGMAYHGLAGLIIAAAAFGVLLSSESADGRTLVNGYAMAAFLTTGLIGGLVYWMFSGWYSGGRRISRSLEAIRAADADAERSRNGARKEPKAASKSEPKAASKAGPEAGPGGAAATTPSGLPSVASAAPKPTR